MPKEVNKSNEEESSSKNKLMVKPKKICEQCNKEYSPRSGYHAISRFCSHPCLYAFKANPKVPLAPSSIEYEVYKPKSFNPPRG